MVIIVFLLLFVVHFVAQQWEHNSDLNRYFKYPGDVANLITGALFNSCLIFWTLYNIYTDELLTIDQGTVSLQNTLLGYFVYDTLFMVLSPSRMYYIKFIIHHLVSIFVILIANAYNCGNNLANNSLIFLLEMSTPLINISKIYNYIQPGKSKVRRLTKIVYFTSRVAMLPVWILVSPFTLYKLYLPECLIYTGIVLVYIASYMWYKNMFN